MNTINEIIENGNVSYKSPKDFSKLVNTDFYNFYLNKNRIVTIEYGSSYFAMDENMTMIHSNFTTSLWNNLQNHFKVNGDKLKVLLIEKGLVTVYKK